jgi:hypothetical protein
MLEALMHGTNKSFPEKTDFCYAHVPVKTGFTLCALRVLLVRKMKPPLQVEYS